MCRWFDSGQSHQFQSKTPLSIALRGVLFASRIGEFQGLWLKTNE